MNFSNTFQHKTGFIDNKQETLQNKIEASGQHNPSLIISINTFHELSVGYLI